MYIYGRNVAISAVKDNVKIKQIFVGNYIKDNKLLEVLDKANINIKYVNKKDMDKMVEGNHGGVILEVASFKYTDLEDIISKEDALVVILDHIEDPHNFGAIIRTCEAAGVDGIIIPKDRAVSVNSTVVKVSTGAINDVKIAQVTNLNSTITNMKKEGFWIVGTDMDGTNYSEIDYKGKCAIVIGNEGSGMHKNVRDNCDFIASIPMNGKTNSLNASVATGIVIFEAVRLRK